MKHRRFAPDEILCRLGDPPTAAFVVIEGEVEVTSGARGDDGSRLGRGEIVGEACLILGQPMAVTVRAVVETTVAVISRDEFLDRAAKKRATLDPVFRQLFHSLHDVTGIISKGVPRAVIVAERPVHNIRILPSSRELQDQMDEAGYPMPELPFRVGRLVLDGENAPPTAIELTLDDVRPYNLSRQHFAIEGSETGPVVRDIWSHLGTLVNGVRIGRAENRQAVPLRLGDNQVVAGKSGSPFIFRVLVEKG
ncbi:MAG: cyclic nucleotide-binding domain-containing protein [Alphaproteobacteria bacterium]|nr:cyclic nucleotide-binding domain-containing protein [Alphaproteobacteria bacterium]